MQRNHIPVVQSKGKKITAVTAIMPGHRARAADNCSWSHTQWSPLGERSHHLSDHIMRPASACATRIERTGYHNNLWTMSTEQRFKVHQHFQSIKTPVFVRKHFKQSPCSIFLIFWQIFGQVLIFSVNSSHWHIGINWRHNYVINSKEYITNRWNIFKHL